MASLSNRISNCFPINSSLKWWLFQGFFGPFTVSPLQNLKKKKKKKKKGQTWPNTKPPDPTRDPYFSGWVGFLPVKPNCYRVGLQVIVKPIWPDPISVLTLKNKIFFHTKINKKNNQTNFFLSLIKKSNKLFKQIPK